MATWSGCVTRSRACWLAAPDETTVPTECYGRMNQPKVQTDVPAEGASSDNNPTGNTPHGIPNGMKDQDATALPNSDRHEAEKVPGKSA